MGEAEQVRAWLEWVRQSPAFTAPGAAPDALFSLGPEVPPLYGSFTSENLKSDRGLIEYALNFANREDNLSALLKDPPPSELYDNDFRAMRDRTDSRRAHLVVLLAGVIRDRLKAPAQFLRAAQALLPHVWAVPTLRGTSLQFHLVINDAPALYAIIAILLMDEKRGLGRALRRCEHCGKFFLVRPTYGRGRPQNRFCEKTCLKAAHNLKTPQRQRRVRARRLLETKYGREKSRDAIERAFRQHPDVSVKELAERAKALLQTARKHK